MNRKDKTDFTQGSILGKLIPFMMPILGALILQAAYGAVDLLVGGRPIWNDSRIISRIDRQSDIKSGYFCDHTVCNGYYGLDRKIYWRKKLWTDR